jgi:6-phosphogluconolactonase
VRLTIESTAADVARAAADWLRDEVEAAVAQRGRCLLALSGGRSPWQMLTALADEPLPWERLQVLQVDERAVPADDERRNALHLAAELLVPGRLPRGAFHAMPVEHADLDAAAAEYEATLERIGGLLPVLDVVQLGLGADGHTASLVPGDAVLGVQDRDVAATAAPYQGTRRMTMTYPLLDRARRVLWLVTGEEKAAALAQLVAGDRAIPAGRVAPARAVVFADRAAAAQLPPDRQGWRG